MGNTYVNYTLRGPSQQEVARVLAGRSAVVSPSRGGCVVVYDAESERQTDNIESLGATLSRECDCPVLAIFVYHDDVLYYRLFESGQQIDDYASKPRLFDEDAEVEESDEDAPTPSGGDARKLCLAFGMQKQAEVEKILRTTRCDFEIFRHEALCKALGLPEFCVASGYGYIARGELPPGLEEADLTRVI